MGILSESGFHNFRSYVHTIGPVTATCQDMKAGCQGEKQELSYRTDFWYGFCVNGRDGEITGIDGFRWRDMPFLKLLCGLLLFAGSWPDVRITGKHRKSKNRSIRSD